MVIEVKRAREIRNRIRNYPFDDNFRQKDFDAHIDKILQDEGIDRNNYFVRGHKPDQRKGRSPNWYLDEYIRDPKSGREKENVGTREGDYLKEIFRRNAKGSLSAMSRDQMDAMFKGKPPKLGRSHSGIGIPFEALGEPMEESPAGVDQFPSIRGAQQKQKPKTPKPTITPDQRDRQEALDKLYRGAMANKIKRLYRKKKKERGGKVFIEDGKDVVEQAIREDKKIENDVIDKKDVERVATFFGNEIGQLTTQEGDAYKPSASTGSNPNRDKPPPKINPFQTQSTASSAPPKPTTSKQAKQSSDTNINMVIDRKEARQEIRDADPAIRTFPSKRELIPPERLNDEAKSVKELNDDIKYFIKNFRDMIKPEIKRYGTADKNNKQALKRIHRAIVGKVAGRTEGGKRGRVGMVIDPDAYLREKFNEFLAQRAMGGLQPKDLLLDVSDDKDKDREVKDVGSYELRTSRSGRLAVEREPIYNSMPTVNQQVLSERRRRSNVKLPTLKTRYYSKVDNAQRHLKENPFISDNLPKQRLSRINFLY